MKVLNKPVVQVTCLGRSSVISGDISKWIADNGVIAKSTQSGPRLYWRGKRITMEPFSVEMLEAMAHVFGGHWQELVNECVSEVPDPGEEDANQNMKQA